MERKKNWSAGVLFTHGMWVIQIPLAAENKADLYVNYYLLTTAPCIVPVECYVVLFHWEPTCSTCSKYIQVKPLNPILQFWLGHTAQCGQVLHQQKGEMGWVHLQGAVHMAAAAFDCKMALVGTGFANSYLDCRNFRNTTLTMQLDLRFFCRFLSLL